MIKSENMWGAVNLSVFINQGKVNFHFKTFQAGNYISRGADIADVNNISGNQEFFNYLYQFYPLYYNGVPLNMIDINGKRFLHSICADAISSIWDCEAILAFDQKKIMSTVPIIIQGDSMNPSWFLSNVMNVYNPNGSGFTCTFQKTGPDSNYPDEAAI